MINDTVQEAEGMPYCKNCGYIFSDCNCGDWEPVYSEVIQNNKSKEAEKYAIEKSNRKVGGPTPWVQKDLVLKKKLEAAFLAGYSLAEKKIAELEALIEQREGEAVELKKTLGMLVALKTHKDAYGKDKQYEEQQPLAWEQARKLLNVGI